MASNEPKTAIPSSPPRPILRLSRSISEASPPKPSASKKHRHHHPHLYRREKDEKINPFNPIPHLSLANSHIHPETRSEGVTPAGSRNGSGRNSILADMGNGGEFAGGMGMGMMARRKVDERDIREERERAALRATELRNELLDLNTLSNDATRRLDNTYYSILEKLSVLHSTIASMTELARLAKKLNSDFDIETQEVIDEVETQMDTFKGFEEQDEKIDMLEGRIKAGRERVKELGDRLEVVRARIDCWEKYEGEWKNKTKTRLRVLWLGTGLVVLAFITLIMVPHISGGKTGADLMHAANISNLSAEIPSFENLEGPSFERLEEKVEEEVVKLAEGAKKAVEGLKTAHTKSVPGEEDPRLRLFDEL